MANDDERNVDEQLDEEQRKAAQSDQHLLIENHQNNTRTDAEERNAIAGASGAITGTTNTVTDPSQTKESRP